MVGNLEINYKKTSEHPEVNFFIMKAFVAPF